MAKAKTASKNNPTSREKAKKMFFMEREVKPSRYISETTSYLSAEYVDTGDLVLDKQGSPIAWNKI